MTTTTRCPGCGLQLPQADGPTHPYIGASPACWELYGQALSRAYSDPLCRPVLQLAVDAYACQHPGVPSRRATQSVSIHLMTLCLVLEDGADPLYGPTLHRHMIERPVFSWLDPPEDRGRRTVEQPADAPSSEAYVAAVWDWARDVWQAWQPHHDVVRSWIQPSLP